MYPLWRLALIRGKAVQSTVYRAFRKVARLRYAESGSGLSFHSWAMLRKKDPSTAGIEMPDSVVLIQSHVCKNYDKFQTKGRSIALNLSLAPSSADWQIFKTKFRIVYDFRVFMWNCSKATKERSISNAIHQVNGTEMRNRTGPIFHTRTPSRANNFPAFNYEDCKEALLATRKLILENHNRRIFTRRAVSDSLGYHSQTGPGKCGAGALITSKAACSPIFSLNTWTKIRFMRSCR